MKSFLKMTLISSAIIFALTGCDDNKDNTVSKETVTQSADSQTTSTNDSNKQATETNENSNETSAENSKENQNIEINADTEAYVVGASFGDYLKNNLDKNKVALNNDQVIKGFEDAFRSKSQYSKEQIQYVLSELDKRLQKEAEDRFTTEKMASQRSGDKFREDFAAKLGVKKTDSGLLYQVMTEGKGKHPKENDTVVVHYTGSLVNGQKFDSSYDRNEPSKFPLNGVIRGWIEGLQLIGVGGKIKLVVPPELAYGDHGQPAFGDGVDIPPAATLVFEVELLGIEDADNGNTNETPKDEAPAKTNKKATKK